MNRALHAEYIAAREAQDERCELVTRGYATEVAAYYGTDGEGDAVERRITWKQWLIDHKSERAPEVMTMVPDLPAFDDSALTDADLFRMLKPELRDLAAVGSKRAQGELDRRAAKRASRRELVAA